MKPDDELEQVRLRVAEHQRKIDDAHRAIGRYIVQFSWLVMRMRQAMEQRLQQPDDPPGFVALAFGDVAANQIATVFFAMCKALGGFDVAEEDVWKKLHDEVLYDAIPKRNDLAHGDWWVELGMLRTPGGPATYYARTKAKGGKGFTATPATAPELDALSDDLRILTGTIDEFGLICFGLHPLQQDGRRPNLRVSDMFMVKGPKGRRCVLREGPEAETIRFVQPP